MDWIMNLIPSWGWPSWLGLGGVGVVGVLAWGLGLPALIRIVASISEVVAPLLRAVSNGVIWVWENVLFPGLKDILDSMATIVTVVLLCGSMFLYMQVNADIRESNLSSRLNACTGELAKLKKKVPAVAEKPLWVWPF